MTLTFWQKLNPFFLRRRLESAEEENQYLRGALEWARARTRKLTEELSTLCTEYKLDPETVELDGVRCALGVGEDYTKREVKLLLDLIITRQQVESLQEQVKEVELERDFISDLLDETKLKLRELKAGARRGTSPSVS